MPAASDTDKLMIRRVTFTDSQNGWFLGTADCFAQGCTTDTVLLRTQDGGKTVDLLWEDESTVSAGGL